MNTRSPTKSRNVPLGIAVICAAAMLAPFSVSLHAAAQSDTKPKAKQESFEDEQQWKAFFTEAKKAYGEKRWAEAKSLLLKASAIKLTSKILGNLAQAEIQLGEYSAAATHAAAALAEPDKSPESAEDLAIASKYVGKLIIETNVEGADAPRNGRRIPSAICRPKPLSKPTTRPSRPYTVDHAEAGTNRHDASRPAARLRARSVPHRS